MPEIFLRSDNLFLAAYQHAGEVSLLYTVSSNQKYPFCSRCSSKKCKCYRRFKKELDDAAGSDEEVDYFWKRLKTERPGQTDNFHNKDADVEGMVITRPVLSIKSKEVRI